MYACTLHVLGSVAECPFRSSRLERILFLLERVLATICQRGNVLAQNRYDHGDESFLSCVDGIRVQRQGIQSRRALF